MPKKDKYVCEEISEPVQRGVSLDGLLFELVWGAEEHVLLELRIVLGDSAKFMGSHRIISRVSFLSLLAAALTFGFLPVLFSALLVALPLSFLLVIFFKEWRALESAKRDFRENGIL